MDAQRNFLFFVFLFVSFFIWQLWNTDNDVKNLQEKIEKKYEKNKNIDNKIFPKKIDDQYIYITTDVLFLKINLYGGNIEQADLLKYPEKLKSSKPFSLLKTDNNFIYQATSGLINNNNENIQPLFINEKKNYFLNDNDNEIHIPILYFSENGVIYKKTFILKRGEYNISVNYYINNNTKNKLHFTLFNQLQQSVEIPENNKLYNYNFVLHTFRGTAYSTDKIKYKKHDFDSIIKNDNLYIQTFNGWISMLQQYFVTAWIPMTPGEKIFYTSNINNNIAVIGYKSSLITMHPNEEKTFNSILWIGPEIQNKMAIIAPYLDLTVDYGWLWFISQPLFKLLKFLYFFVGNWGFSIILITLIVRFIMYPLTKVQYSSAEKMRILQPKIHNLHNKFGQDKQKLSQELMNLYKSEKINPFGGCLPLLVQMPIFLALYYMLISSVELRHAHFIFWIHDLTDKDPYYILPIIMGITMFLIQRISPISVTDPIQKKIMLFMPAIFSIFFLWFPSGLVLYYIISNLVTMLQQKLIQNKFKKK